MVEVEIPVVSIVPNSRSLTVSSRKDSPVQVFRKDLASDQSISFSSRDALPGDKFRVVKQKTAKNLNVGGLKLIPDGTAAFADVEFSGQVGTWILTAYGVLSGDEVGEGEDLQAQITALDAKLDAAIVGVTGEVTFFSDVHQVTGDSHFTWDNSAKILSVTSLSAGGLTVSSNATIGGTLGVTGIVTAPTFVGDLTGSAAKLGGIVAANYALLASPTFTGTPLAPTATVGDSTTKIATTAFVMGAVTSASTVFANPTATVGLTAVNGVATTAMRSDAAPALDQGIIPIWTGIHRFSNATASSSISTGAVVISTGGLGIGGDLFGTTGTFNATLQGTILNATTGFRAGGAATSGHVLRGNGTNFVDAQLGSGDINNTTFVTSVSGTSSRITSTGGLTPVLDISALYVGQTSLTTLGTIGTGVWQGTKIGLVYGGTNADLSGTGGTSQFLRQSSTGAAVTVSAIAAADLPGSFSGFANPSASTGLTAVNGAATTAMRSDAAPALSQAIVPTWTGAHTWNVGGAFSGNAIVLDKPDPTTNPSRYHSDVLQWVGKSYDGSLHKVQWSANVNMTTTAGVNFFRLRHVLDSSGAIEWHFNSDGSFSLPGAITGSTGYNGLVITADTGVVTTGTWNATKVGLAYGGTNANLSATGGTSQYLKQSSTGAAVTVGTIAASDVASGATLTKTDDTNVTVTLGGTPTTALLSATSLTIGWTGTLAVSRGGIGVGTLASNGVLYGNGTSAVQALTINSTATQKYLGQVSSGAPTWNQIASTEINNTTFLTAIAGTSNRISVTGGLVPAIDISASYIGQSSITTLGTITTGVWNAGAVTSSGNISGVAGIFSSSVQGLYFNSTVSTGTAPLIVASTTKVTNLNVDFLAGYAPSVSVAAGTIPVYGTLGVLEVGTPAIGIHAANKDYVDTAVTRATKASVDVATTSALPSYSFLSNVLTASANGAFPTTDGVSITTGKTILVKNETSTNQPYNGAFDVTDAGSAGTKWVLTRRADSDSSAEMPNGTTYFISSGALNGAQNWTLTTPNPITLNTTGLTFSQTGGSSLYINGNGIVIVGNTINFSTSSNYVVGGLFKASSTTAVDQLGLGTTTTVLHGNASGAPTWSAISLTADVTGTLPVGAGGTGAASLTANAVLYGNSTSAVQALALNSGSIKFLTQASSSAPAWTDLFGGANTWTNANTLNLAAIGSTVTDAWVLTNTTASTSGNPVQYSPALRFTTHVWNTTPTAADNQFDYRVFLFPVSGTAPTARLSFQVSSDGGSTFAETFSLSNTGLVTVSNKITGLSQATGATDAVAAGRTITIAGTTNQVISSAGAQSLTADRTWTLSLPQNIHTGATPTFAGLTLTGNLVGTTAGFTGAVSMAGLTATTGIFSGAVSGITTLATSSTINGQTLGTNSDFTGTINVATGYRIGGAATSGNVLRGDGTNFVSAVLGSGDITNVTFVTAVTGTTNRITSSGGLTPAIDISASYIGQSSITTVGTIGTGTWHGTAVDTAYGGTGLTSVTTGDLLYGSGSVWGPLNIGTAGYILMSVTGVPAWQPTTQITTLGTIAPSLAISNPSTTADSFLSVSSGNGTTSGKLSYVKSINSQTTPQEWWAGTVGFDNWSVKDATAGVTVFTLATSTGNAQFHGNLSVVGTTISALSATVTASAFAGDGSALTALNATQLTSGTVPVARLSGSYTGITGVGTIAAGVWNGSLIGMAYGGTSSNLTASAGGLVYSTSSALAITSALTGVLLGNGTGAPTANAAGTAGTLAKWGASGTSLANSIVSESGAALTVGGTINLQTISTTASFTGTLGVAGLTTLSGNLSMGGASNNWISFGTVGAAPPSTLSLSAGTKIILDNTRDGTNYDYAIGIDTNVLWFTLAANPAHSPAHAYKWYAGGTVIMTLDSDSNFTMPVSTASLGVTGTRIAAGYFTNLTVTNAISGSVTGGAGSSTLVAVTDDSSTNAVMYPTWVTASSGNQANKVSSTKLTFNPSTGLLSSTGFAGALTGNASTATALQTSRNINGVAFDGTAAITITAAAGTLTGTALNSTVVTSSLTSVGTLASLVLSGAVTGATGYNGLVITANTGVITTGTWNGSVIGLVYGGTAANLTASNGGIVYSTASAMAILAGTATAGQIIRSGASTTPSWSTATYPSTIARGDILLGSAANIISGLTIGTTGKFLRTDGTDPSWQPVLAPDIGSGETLSKTDDTNITLTLGGTPTAALLKSTSLTLGWTGLLSYARGGINKDLTATGGAGQFLKQTTVGGAITVAAIAAGDLPGSFSGFANPSATVSLTAVNGSATTAMRSDAAPALSAAIAPTWTGIHTFTNATSSAFFSGGPTLFGSASQAQFDANGLLSIPTGTLGSATMGLYFTGDTNTGLYQAGADVLKLVTGGTARLSMDGSGNVAVIGTLTATTYTGQSSIVTVGTVGTGVWQGTKVGLAYGGTNADLSATGGASQFLRQSSSGAAVTVSAVTPADLPGLFSGFANPTSSIGLTAVNGSATTAMRSDSAPALSQGIVPTWTGIHTHNPGTTPQNAILLDIAALGSAGTRNSHTLQWTGRAYDTGAHNSDWVAFVTETSNAGASSWILQSRIDAVSFATRLTVGDGGLITVTNKITGLTQATGATDAVAAGRTITLTGTANQVSVSAGSQDLTADRSWTLSVPQNIHSGASPTFVGLTLSGAVTGATGYNGLVVAANTGVITTGIWNAAKVGLAYGGTNSDLSATGGASQYLKQSSSGAAVTVGTIAASDIASGAALTKTDDANVTLTLGGTPTTALLAATSVTVGWTGNLSVARGGTGGGSLTSNAVLYGNGASAIQTVSVVSGSRQFLTQSSSAAPTFYDLLGSTNSWTANQTFDPGNIAATATYRLFLTNTVASTALVPVQYSAALGFKGFAWDSTNSINNAFEFRTYLSPITGATPSAKYVVEMSNQGSVFAEIFSLRDSGLVTVTNKITGLSQATGTTDAVAGGRQITLTGTTNQVSISAGAQNLTADRTWTLSLPQNIHSGASPTFVGLSLTGAVTGATGYNGLVITANTGVITTGTWNGSVIGLVYGGTAANLTASNGGIVYSTASAMAILAGTATAGQIIRSGASTTPSWSTATYPGTVSRGDILVGSSANVISGLTVGTTGKFLRTDGTDASWQLISESDVTNLVSDLALKAPLASPTFTGVPVAPTASTGTNTTQLATTAFVLAQIGASTSFANPSALLGLTAVNGSATTAMRSDAAPALDQSITPTWTGLHTHNFAGIGTTITDATYLTNNAAATVGAQQQYSPALRFRAQAWNTSGTPANNTFDFRFFLLPTGGSTPTTKLSVQVSNNGATYAEKLALADTGQVTVYGKITNLTQATTTTDAVAAGRSITLTGTANQVNVSTGAQDLTSDRTWILSLPQNIHSGSSPTFVGLTLSGAITGATGYNGLVVTTNTGVITAGTWNATKVGLAYGGTNADLSATGGTSQYLKQSSSGAAITVGTIGSTEITNTTFVTSVTGTASRITSSGGLTPVIDISASYAGQSSITTLGTIAPSLAISNPSTTADAFLSISSGNATTSGKLSYVKSINSQTTPQEWWAGTVGFDNWSVKDATAGVTVFTLAITTGNAQFHGNLSVVGTVVSAPSATITASAFSGDGSALTALNATQLTSGTVPSGRVAGSYTGITGVGTLTVGTWTATNIALANGGTNASLTASNGGIVYSTASAMAILAGTATAGQIILSGSSTTPTWSTSTYPSTTARGDILRASSANVISGLTIGTTGKFLRTDGTDPSWQSIAESDVTNLVSDLALKAPLASPTFTGVPAAPTATAGTNTTQVATTAFVLAQIVASTSFANPTASIGLTAVNGSATTAMRSDAAPALSQAIVPTWTGAHTFNQAGITTTYTPAIFVSNTTASLVGVTVQQSPSIKFLAHVWNTTTPADNTFEVREQLIPTSGTTPTAKISWQFSNNGGTFADKLALSDTGILTVSNKITGLSQATGATDAVAAGRTITIAGTTNQVTVSTGAQDLTSDRTWTLSLPQNIHSGASPTFVGLTLSGAVTGATGYNGLVVTANTGVVTTGTWNAGAVTSSTQVQGTILNATTGFRIGGAATSGNVLRGNGTNFVDAQLGSGDVNNTTFLTNVTGTSSRITSSGGLTPAIDISASYVGQNSITTLGTITTGVWNAGAVTSSGAISGTTGAFSGGSVTLSNGTSNWLNLGTNGVAPPTTTTTRSLGTKIILDATFSSGAATDYAIGIDTNALWMSLPNVNGGPLNAFKWYAGTTLLATLDENRNLTFGTSSGDGQIGSAALKVGAGYFSNLTVANPIAGSVTGGAGSSTLVAVTDDSSTNAVMYPTWVTASSGNQANKVSSTKLTFNPSTGLLASTSFTGAGTGLTGTAASLTAGIASVAVALQTARAINGVNFDGTSAITVTADANTLSGTTLHATVINSSLTSVGTLTSLSSGAITSTAQVQGTVLNATTGFRLSGSAASGNVLRGDGTNFVSAVLAPGDITTGSFTAGSVIFAGASALAQDAGNFVWDSINHRLGIRVATPGVEVDISGGLRVSGGLINGGFDFTLGNTDQSTRGNSGSSRALVKAVGNILTVNYLSDFSGGTQIAGGALFSNTGALSCGAITSTGTSSFANVTVFGTLGVAGVTTISSGNLVVAGYSGDPTQGVIFLSNSGNSNFIYNSGNQIQIRVNGSDRLTIDSAGSTTLSNSLTLGSGGVTVLAGQSLLIHSTTGTDFTDCQLTVQSGGTGKPSHIAFHVPGVIANHLGSDDTGLRTFNQNGTAFADFRVATLTATGMSVSNTITSTGSNAGFLFADQTTGSPTWKLYTAGGGTSSVARLYNSTNGDMFTVSAAGNGFFNGTCTASQFNGSGAGLTGTAGSLNVQPYNIIVGNFAQGTYCFASVSNSSTAYTDVGLQIRESQYGGSGSYLAPRLAFHWGGVVASQITIESSGTIAIVNNLGTNYESFKAAAITATVGFVGPLTGNVTGNTSGSSGSCTGNAATATALATARAINGVNFDGTIPITVTADANTLSGTTLHSTVVTSSLTSVGTLSSLALSGAITGATTIAASSSVSGLYFNSTISTGTAPLIVASATLVSNLNSDYLSGQHGSFYQDAGNISAGTLNSSRISGSYSGITGLGTIASSLAISNLSTSADAFLSISCGNGTTSGKLSYTKYVNSQSSTQEWRVGTNGTDSFTVYNQTLGSAVFTVSSSTSQVVLLGNLTVNGTGTSTVGGNLTVASVLTVNGVAVNMLSATVTAASFWGDGAALTNLNGSNIASGIVPAVNLGSGSSITTKFLRGDNTWQTVSSTSGSALTKTDDTNVTLTLGGSPTTALVNAASVTVGWTGTLVVSRGGTGAGTFTSNAVIYGNGTSALQAVTVNSSGTKKYLQQVSSGTPAFVQVDYGDLSGSINGVSVGASSQSTGRFTTTSVAGSLTSGTVLTIIGEFAWEGTIDRGGSASKTDSGTYLKVITDSGQTRYVVLYL